MQILQPITDPTFTDTPANTFEKILLKLINDKRDLPFFYVTIKISLTIIPLAILLFLPVVSGPLWWVIAAVYLFLNNITFKGPFGLMLHCTSHRKFFNKRFRLLNHYLPWVIGPFFGQTPETYYSHHIWMHHPEIIWKMTAALRCLIRETAFVDFLRYFFDFLFLGMFRLVSYFHKKTGIC
jgi:hypothetical protein